MSATITINSANRENKNDDISHFIINIGKGQPFKTQMMELIEVYIPISHFTIMTGINDEILFEVSSVEYTAILTERIHTTFATLATDIQTQMNSAYTPDNLFTCTYDSTVERFTIVHPTASSILKFSQNKVYKQLGFRELDTSDALSHTSPLIANLQYGQSYIIHSSDIAPEGSSYVYPESSNFNVGHFVVNIMLTGNFGDIMTYEPKQVSRYKFDYDFVKNFEKINIKVSFEDGATFVPLNLDWHMVFRYKIAY